jgi:hypothetical protein
MSKELQKHEPAKLPTIEELHHDTELAFKNDQLNLLLYQPPPDKWLKDHPTAKQKVNGESVPVKYLPVEKVEFLLTKIFQRWSVEVVSYTQLFQSIAVHVRLKVENPLDGTFIIQDGLGAVAVQTEAGASAADLSKIKSDAVMKALPAAESYAIKDAAEKLGRIFGKDLNRKDITAFDTPEKVAARWQMNGHTVNQ